MTIQLLREAGLLCSWNLSLNKWLKRLSEDSGVSLGGNFRYSGTYQKLNKPGVHGSQVGVSGPFMSLSFTDVAVF